VAVEDVAEVLLVAHLLDVEVTMVTMETATVMANQRGTTNSKMARNLDAGGATFTDTVKRIKANAPCKGLNGSTYWPKNKASPVGEEDDEKEVQGAVGGQMYTGQLVIVKENYVLQWGNLQNNLQPKFIFPVPIYTQHHDYSAIPMNKCYNTDSFTIRKNFEHYHRWKTALCQVQSEWLWKKLFI